MTTDTTQYLSVRFTIFTDSEVIDGLSIQEQNELCQFSVQEPWELDEKAKEVANTFQGRILSKLMEREEEKVALENQKKERRLQARRERLILKGICSEEEARQFIKDPFHELPSPIYERHMEFVAREREKEREDEENTEIKKARSIYQNPWLQKKEKEMGDLVKKAEESQDEEIKRTLETLIQITENKIKLFHEKNETINQPIVLKERKKYCLAEGLLTEEAAVEVGNIYVRLPPHEENLTPPPTPSWTPSPTMRQERSMQESPMSRGPPKTPSWSPMLWDPPKTPSWSPRFNSEDSQETFITPESTTGNDSDDMFITPKPRRIIPETPNALLGTQRKRKRSRKSKSSQKPKSQNTMHTYFAKKN